MASGASSLDSNESSASLSHGFIPSSERTTLNLPTIPLPLDFESLAQNSNYDKQSSYQVVKQPTYEGMNPSYDSLTQSQYEGLPKQNNEGRKQQCDNTLRRQHSEISQRYEQQTIKKLEYSRRQHRAVITQLEVSALDSNNFLSKNGEMLNDNQRLERDVQRLQEGNNSINGGTGSTGPINNETTDTALMHTLRTYDALKEEYDCLRKRYDGVISTHSPTADQQQACQEENAHFKTQIHELTQERNSAIRERNGLKQQCTAAIRQWDIALRERNEYRDALGKVSSQHEEAVREMNQAMGVRVKATKDIKRLTDERNAAMHEYSLIMSERDTVHKEMEKLSDDLQRAVKRAQGAEAEFASVEREKRALGLQAESLRREIASALLDRDRALRECSDLSRNAANNQPSATKTRLDNSAYHGHGHGLTGPGKDGSNGGQHGTDASIDKLQGLVGMVLNPRDKERVDNLETANQELDKLRKSLDKLQSELTEAHQEAEVSKRRRDWAFSERDKIVLERESIRTLCDRLRKERDRAVSDLAEALRDSDDIKKQRNEASKELKELKEKFETELEKEESNSCRVHHSPITHNHSRDSAIDADLQEWESELLEIDLIGIPSTGDMGFELVGGRDDPYFPNDHGVYVASVQKGSVADGKLKVADCIVEGTGVGVMAGARGVWESLKNSSGGRARLLVKRKRVRSRCLHTAQLNRANVAEHGLTLDQGIYISKISPGSLAAKEGNLAIGDRVLSINNKSMDGLKSAVEAMMILNDRHFDMVTITTLKTISHSGSTNSDLSNRFSPVKESSNKNSYSISHHMGKMVNSCSQTEDPFCQYLHPGGDQKVATSHHFENPVGDFDRRYIYKVTTGNPTKSHEKSHSTSGNHEKGTWDMILGKIEAVTGRSKSKDKQNRQSAVPESDAIAELDSVIDSYHGKTSSKESSSGGVLKRSKRRSKDNSSQSASESAKNNGGTWPRARSNVIFQQNPTGTIVQPRSKKERPALSILLSPPTKLQQSEQQWCNRNSNPIPLSHLLLAQGSTPSRHSVYKCIESAPDPSGLRMHFPKPLLSGFIQFSPSNFVNFEKPRSTEKDKRGMADFAERDIAPDRLSRNLNPSDDSLDFQAVADGKSPNSLDFMGNSGKSPGSLEFALPAPSLSKNLNSFEFSLKHPDYYALKKSSSKTVSKYPSDSESLGPDSLPGGLTSGLAGTLPSHSRIQSQLYRAVPPYVNPHPHHLPPVRYPNPSGPTPPMTQSRSGESIGAGYECAAFGSHSHNASEIQPGARAPRGNPSGDHYHHGYEGGTFPRKKENPRFRIPSNPSVTSKNSAGKVSTGSIERSSERGSPMPTFHVEVLSPGRGARAKRLPHTNTRNSVPEYCGFGWHRPLPGELRRVHIDKSQQPLGIQISCPPESGGVFVSTVNEHSLASQVGLQVGDQLLEVCGINMRSATYKLAANVLRQCGNSITMLVQYSPDKYNEPEGTGSSSEEHSGDEGSASGSPTPRNSPGPQRALRSEPPPPDVNGDRKSQSGNEPSEPRFLLIEMRKSSDLGISLVGGNAVGIFVHSVRMDSPAYDAGLRTGDQILEYNSADLRRATAEQAALELAKPADKVSVLARLDLQRYHEIKDKPGDAFFVRAGFDRSADLGSSGVDPQFDAYSLWFRRDEVIFVDNTLFNGAPGLWRAWQLDQKGNKQQWGTIPSKFKVEELLRRSVGSLEGTESGQNQSRRRYTATRRSFFRRKKHRDPKELASFSNTNLGWWSDSGNLNEELPLCSYQRVERLHYPAHRPVVVLGPLWECVVEKVVSDFPNEFNRATPELIQLTGPSLDRALSQGKYLEPRKRGNYLECIALQAIKEACDRGMHCILDVSVASIEKLHKQQIYPIVLLIKFKSTKQIKEIKDTRYPMEKVSAKAAKEMYEHALKLETEYRQYVSAVIPAGANIAYMCTQLKAAVDEEQTKTLWAPSQQT